MFHQEPTPFSLNKINVTHFILVNFYFSPNFSKKLKKYFSKTISLHASQKSLYYILPQFFEF